MPSPPGMKENLTSCVSPHQKDPMSNGCLSTLLVKKKKMILHIFCTSLTVSIEPGPCGFAEGSRGVTSARTQPRPREGGGKARGRRSSNRAPGAKGEGRVAASRPRFPRRPRPRPVCGSITYLHGSPELQTSGWACRGRRHRLPGKGQPALDKTRWC